jgi:hypothetical protein
MRSDYLSIYLMRQWLERRGLLEKVDWPDALTADVPDRVKLAAQKLNEASGDTIDSLFMAQGLLARVAIEKWGLENVAILGGGRPQPFSPSPDQVLYYTDIDEDVLAEAHAEGYNTVKVDAREPDDFEHLEGAETIVATGLFHFLSDEAIQTLLNLVGQMGFTHAVFNNTDPAIDPRLYEIGKRDLGLTMYPRTIEDIRQILPDDWQLEQAMPMSEFAKHVDYVGPKIEEQPQMVNVFMATRLH